MAIPILVEALFFFLAFSALPVSVIYWIKSREHWIIPYILIQVVTLVYVCVDILFTGAGRTLAPELPLSLFLEMQTSLRILLLVLVPLFLNNLLDLAEKERRMICWGAIAGLSLIGFLLFTPILPTARGAAWTRDFTFRSPVYLWVSAASVGLAVYTVIIAARVRNASGAGRDHEQALHRGRAGLCSVSRRLQKISAVQGNLSPLSRDLLH
jgi:hypothetical protein